jgi:hypothetical protein
MFNHTKSGDLIYDGFIGSGTTLIAAETCGRVGLGIEIEPRYVDVSIRRWQNFTGQKAVLDGAGKSFEEIAAERNEKRNALERTTVESPKISPAPANSPGRRDKSRRAY